ncbi:hypothetical protein PV327_000734, partial [Microctonus hyperodae]
MATQTAEITSVHASSVRCQKPSHQDPANGEDKRMEKSECLARKFCHNSVVEYKKNDIETQLTSDWNGELILKIEARSARG